MFRGVIKFNVDNAAVSRGCVPFCRVSFAAEAWSSCETVQIVVLALATV